MNPHRPLILLGTLALFSTQAGLLAQDRIAEALSRLQGADETQLAVLLKRFPAADANRDGTLSRDEAVAHARSLLAGLGTPAPGKSAAPEPTAADVPYGPHARNRLDFWKAAGAGPRPLVIFIHGGGFTGGDKAKWRESGEIARLLQQGISCAAINYRFRKDAPIQDILRDAARAVQYLRSRAGEWGLDKNRFAGWGGSAGAGTSLWLATRDDLADAENADPVLRESSRLQAAVLLATQATYDLTRWESYLGPPNPAWWTSPNEAAEFYHFAAMSDLDKPEARLVLRECDMLSWISADDAPVFVNNRGEEGPSRNRGHYLHHPAHAREIAKACQAAGVKCQVVGGDSGAAGDPVTFVIEALKGTGAE